MHTCVIIFVFSALFSSSYGVCTLYDLRCCLTEFERFVRPSGIDLSETGLASACTLKDETLDCMQNFLDQCLRNGTDDQDIRNLVNKTSTFIGNVCPPTSEFMKSLAMNEECILNSSRTFQACYNRTVTPHSTEDENKTDCCEYKELFNCAVQTVENRCGANASQLVHEQVENINGAVFEWACNDMFGKCGNSAVMLASSAFFVLFKIMLLKFLL